MNSRILPSVALIIAIGMFLAYVNPTWNGSIASLKESIASDDEALASARQYSAQQNQLAASRDAIDPANLSAISTFLPDSVDNVGIILDLNALAARSGLSVVNIDVVTGGDIVVKGKGAGALPAAADLVGSVDLSLAAVGTFSALETFLKGVEGSARLLDVRDLVVLSSNTGVYDYQMILRLYWLR